MRGSAIVPARGALFLTRRGLLLGILAQSIKWTRSWDIYEVAIQRTNLSLIPALRTLVCLQSRIAAAHSKGCLEENDGQTQMFDIYSRQVPYFQRIRGRQWRTYPISYFDITMHDGLELHLLCKWP